MLKASSAFTSKMVAVSKQGGSTESLFWWHRRASVETVVLARLLSKIPKAYSGF